MGGEDEYEYLSENKEENVEPESKKKTVHYLKLLKYASGFELFLFAVGVVMSCLVGSSMPVSFLFFSGIINAFVDTNNPGLDFNVVETLVQRFAILGLVTYFVAFWQSFCLQLTSKLQAKRIRRLYYEAILRQDVAWFDKLNVGTAITHLTEGVDKIETGIGEKLGLCIQFLLIFVSGLIIGFIKNWKLSLVACAVFPLVVVTVSAMGIIMKKYSVKEREAYSKANSIAGEVLSSIRTIFAFEGQNKELLRYESELGTAEKLGIKRSILFNCVLGCTDASMYILLAITFWYGIVLINKGESDPGDVILVVFAMLFGSSTLGQSFQQFDHFNAAKVAAAGIFETIDRVPPIDKQAPGKTIEELSGEIVFKNVCFEYPMRKDVTVLKNFNMTIRSGQTVAIVGPSGSGKSTVIQLIQRFYDASSGEIKVDGMDIRDLDLQWFRSKLGVVSQEPVLFAGTVSENIRLGKMDATQDQIEAAAKLSGAHEFVMRLPEGYESFIAEGGGGLSGGQKQRIAIARALIRDPRILLLDEATSALDTRSEAAVQKALDNARIGRTVVIVAHRLSTVRDADVIMVVDNGVIKESGTHSQLVQMNGIYAKLVSKSAEEGPSEAENAIDEDSDEEINKTTYRVHKKVSMEIVYLESEIPHNILFGKNPALWDVVQALHRDGIHEQLKSAGDDEYENQSVVSFKSQTTVSSVFSVVEPDVSATKEVLRMNKPETVFLIFGVLMAVINGLVNIAFPLIYTEMYDIFQERNEQKRLDRIILLAIVLIVLAVIRISTLTFGGYCMGVAGERLTKRCRILLFQAILNQEVGWFDATENQPGILTAALAADVPTLQNISGRRLSSMLETCVLIIGSLIVAFIFSWQIALVALAFFPVLMVAGAFQMKQWTGDTQKANVKGAGLAHETLSNARTVFSLGAEEHFCHRYTDEALVRAKKIVKDVSVFSVVSALVNSLMNFEFAACFYVAGILITKMLSNFSDVIRSYTAISFGAQNLGMVAAYAPDTKKAKVAIIKIFKILKREPLLSVNDGKFPSTGFQGDLAFKNVRFRYPTRKKIPVLKEFTYHVPFGKSVALVGQSGCGKSTVLQLVQRFYDVTAQDEDDGIFMDGTNIRRLAPNWIRRQLGVVSQEPNLLHMSIRENIAYGLNYEEPSMDDIIDAARQANAHDFIMDLPEGYDTDVGPRGSQLSGGQKQRVAIARALIRNPRLLVLDEATAALDNESERVVQAALDQAMQKGERTTLVVAHRLTTVEKCDQIVVLENGKTVETGPPATLMERKGAYYALHKADVNIKQD